MGKKNIKRTFKISIILSVLILLTWISNYSRSVNAVSDTNPKMIEIEQLAISDEMEKVIDEYDQWVSSMVAEGKVPGAAVAIVKGKHVVHMKGYGLRSYASGDSVNEHTVFRLASVSKGFAGVLAGILSEKGYFDLSDPVDKYLPDFHLKDTLNSSELNITHLLSHTTGLGRHAYTDLIENGTDYQEMLANLQALPLIGPVGTYYSYQNVIYSLISDIANQSTGEDYPALVNKYIFQPAGMADASADFASISAQANVALPHVKTYNGWRPTKISETYYNVSPAAGINASISDMSKWLSTLMGYHPQVINPETLQRVYTPVVRTPMRKYRGNWPEIKKAYYALGWRVLDLNEHQLVYHGGYVNHYRAEIAFDPEEEMGIVILTNAPGELSNKGVSKFMRAYYEVDQPIQVTTAMVPAL